MSKSGKRPDQRSGRRQARRIFSEAFKRKKVKDIECSLITVRELSKLYSVSESAIYKWLYKYSDQYNLGTVQVVQMESEEHKTKELLNQIKELEAALGRKQLSIDYLEKLLSVASAELKVDIKKNFDTKSSRSTIKATKKGVTK